MATCEQVKSFVQAYIDEELQNAERLIFEQHLTDCRACRALLEAQKASSAMLFEAYAQHRLKESLCVAVMAHLPEMETPRSMRRDSSYRTTPHPEQRRSRFVTLLPALVPVILLVLGLAIAYSWPPLIGDAVSPIGMVTFLDGKAHHAHADSTVRGDIVLRESVYPGQRFTTSSNASMMLALAGPTFIKMNGETRLKVRDERAVSLENGHIWLQVGKDGRYFQVSTPNGDITVFGTEFDVHVDFERTIVTVGKGEVQVENDKSFTVLRRNDQVTVSLGQQHLNPSKVNADLVLAWSDTIEADPQAERAFWKDIKPGLGKLIPAEQVFAVKTMGKPVSSILLEWNDDALRSGHCSYTVYISDDKMDPMYRGVIEGEVFDTSPGNSFELDIDNGPIENVGVLHIKVVPNIRDEGFESSFSSVSAMSI